ncbi:MAG: NAD-dependent epimerase/dehydratase family protein, partial [Candidatus Aminicenantes bacterium]
MKPGRIVIAGASGFIGRALVRELAENGHEVVALTRNAEAARARLPEGVQAAEWDGRTVADWRRHVDGALAIVNLVGDNLARGRWTRAKKE